LTRYKFSPVTSRLSCLGQHEGGW